MSYSALYFPIHHKLYLEFNVKRVYLLFRHLAELNDNHIKAIGSTDYHSTSYNSQGIPLRSHYLGHELVSLRWHLSERSNNFPNLLSIAENLVQTSLSKGVHAMAWSRLSWV